jgi:hypothetical protein
MGSQLQELSYQYNALLTQYKDTYKEYLNVLNNNRAFTTVKNASFIGKNNLFILDNTNLSTCKNACLENNVCSGATFNTRLENCVLSRGSGNIVQSKNSISFVKQAIYYSYLLQYLNSQLFNINKRMMDISKNNYIKFNETQYQTQYHEKILQNNYATLYDERFKIEKMIREFQTLNTAYEDGNINVTSKYYIYIALLLLALLLFFLLLRSSLSGKQSGGGNNILHLFSFKMPTKWV